MNANPRVVGHAAPLRERFVGIIESADDSDSGSTS